MAGKERWLGVVLSCSAAQWGDGRCPRLITRGASSLSTCLQEQASGLLADLSALAAPGSRLLFDFVHAGKWVGREGQGRGRQDMRWGKMCTQCDPHIFVQSSLLTAASPTLYSQMHLTPCWLSLAVAAAAQQTAGCRLVLPTWRRRWPTRVPRCAAAYHPPSQVRHCMNCTAQSAALL